MRVTNPSDFRILIVDDQTDNLRVLSAVLELAGYTRITCLGDSRELLAVVHEVKPDLLMLDLHMPHVDGLTALDQLATVIPEDDYLPVLVLTGDATSQAKERALSHGAHDFLSKPLNRTEVQLRVRNLLETRRLHLQLRAQNASLAQQVRERTELADNLASTNLTLQETQDQLVRAKDEAERANRAKSEFLSRMSHELRTPLNAILGFAQMLSLAELAAQHHDNARQILKGGYHLLELINEVLDLARIEAGRLEVSLEPVRIGHAVTEILELVGPIASQRNIALNADLATNGNRYVQADLQRFKQVLLNLLSNAIKFNRNNGSVRLRCDVTDHSTLHIEVADTGPGIDEEGLKKIFTPFERLNADRNAIGGTGLGLALAKRMIEAMGGTIGVESTPGAGSKFWFELPLADYAADPEEVRDSGFGADSGPDIAYRGTVLYIEDDLSNLRLIEEIVGGYPGVQLLEATQGKLGLELAIAHAPDWILLDLHLPDISGEEVLEQLRKDPRTESIPVTILSADATPGRIKGLQAAGAREYLTKPMEVRQLIELLERTLRREQPEAQAGSSGPTRLRRNVYPETSSRWAAEAVTMAELPGDMIEQLRRAVQNGAKAKLDQLIVTVGNHDAECARTLQGLADSYDYDALTSLLAQASR